MKMGLFTVDALVGAGFTPALLREGIKPSPTFSCVGAVDKSAMSIYEVIKVTQERLPKMCQRKVEEFLFVQAAGIKKILMRRRRNG